MLERIDASHFSPSTGKVCAMQLPDGSRLQVLVDSVSVKPQYRNPYAPETQRLPFSVALISIGATDFVEGQCSLELEDFGLLEGVSVSRVAPLGRDPNVAYYQIVFN